MATATDYQGKVRKDYADIALISSQDETFGYDENGNMTGRSEDSSTTTYSYDFKNRLTGIDFPDSLPDQEYVYDGFGNRVQSTVGSEVTKYIYSGSRSILELDGQDNVTAVLVRGSGKGGGIGSIIEIERGGQSQYLHYNWRGDVVLVTDSNEQIIQKYDYEAFGKQLNSTSVDNDYQFSTKEYNEDSGLQYFGRRFYDPELGRFISPDPLWFIDGHNKYNFCLNNPIRFITRSWEKTLKHSFKASLEGSTVMRNTILGVYRNRQRYTSEKGIILPGDASENSGILPPYKPPYDAKSALELLRYARDAVEYDREDMYGYGTRHFSGLISLPDDSESGTRIFEYWVNIRTLLTVRLIITHVERNLDIDKRGIPINKEMYINIRYYDWR